MRIVSLCPSLTELVFDLGAGADLVGRTKFCVHPANAVDAVEKLGGTKNPKVDRIIELGPDLVLMNQEENRLEDAVALQQAGIPCHVSFPEDIGGTMAMVLDIGARLGRREVAQAIAGDIEVEAARLEEECRGLKNVRYIYLIWRDPYMLAAGQTFVSAMLSLAGGVNAFEKSVTRYPEVSIAEIAAAGADVLFLSTEPFPFTENHVTEVSALTGVPPDRIVIADGEYLSWHGSRTPRGIRYVGTLMRAVRERSNGGS